MAKSLTHFFVPTTSEGVGSGVPGGPVGPNEWNADHRFYGDVDAKTANYTLADSDQFSLITFNSASAITLSIPRAALGANSHGDPNFANGWFCFIKNIGAGALTFTPTISTVEGYVTALGQDVGGILFSDGANYIWLSGGGNFATQVQAETGTDNTTLMTPLRVAQYAAQFSYVKLNVENQVLTGGVNVTSKDLGTLSTGTLTLDMGDRPQQHYSNAGAHTLAPGATPGSTLLDITNASGAGVITPSGWTKVVGDGFTVTVGSKFRCHCSVGNGGSLLAVQALQ